MPLFPPSENATLDDTFKSFLIRDESSEVLIVTDDAKVDPPRLAIVLFLKFPPSWASLMEAINNLAACIRASGGLQEAPPHSPSLNLRPPTPHH